MSDLLKLEKLAKLIRYWSHGLGEAVRTALEGTGAAIHSLAVRKLPKSGKPREFLDDEEIAKKAIIRKVKELL